MDPATATRVDDGDTRRVRMIAATPLSPTPCAYRVSLLGAFRLDRDGAAVDTGRWQRPSLNLLQLLVTAPEKRRLRDDVIDVLWPEAAPQAGSSNLRYTVHRLRRDL